MENISKDIVAVAYIIRNESSFFSSLCDMEFGYANGYVAINEHNLLYGMEYCPEQGTSIEEYINAHGGITLTEKGFHPERRPQVIAIQLKDGTIIDYKDPRLSDEYYHFEFKDVVKDNWWTIGFDTWHCGDNNWDQDKEFCVKETKDLFNQVVEHYNKPVEC